MSLWPLHLMVYKAIPENTNEKLIFNPAVKDLWHTVRLNLNKYWCTNITLIRTENLPRCSWAFWGTSSHWGMHSSYRSRCFICTCLLYSYQVSGKLYWWRLVPKTSCLSRRVQQYQTSEVEKPEVCVLFTQK